MDDIVENILRKYDARTSELLSGATNAAAGGANTMNSDGSTARGDLLGDLMRHLNRWIASSATQSGQFNEDDIRDAFERRLWARRAAHRIAATNAEAADRQTLPGNSNTLNGNGVASPATQPGTFDLDAILYLLGTPPGRTIPNQRVDAPRRSAAAPRPSLGANNDGSPIPEGIPKTGNDSEILRLHTYKHVYEGNEHQRNSLDDSTVAETCTFCLAIYMDGDLVRRLPCMHLFHTACADAWLTENLICPSCRSKIVIDDN